jgi:hypothetical protein
MFVFPVETGCFVCWPDPGGLETCTADGTGCGVGFATAFPCGRKLTPMPTANAVIAPHILANGLIYTPSKLALTLN